MVNDDLVNASGKMLLLNRLLDALFQKGHKVLLFSQFTTMLDVIVSPQQLTVSSVLTWCRRTGRLCSKGSKSVESMEARPSSRDANRCTSSTTVEMILMRRTCSCSAPEPVALVSISLPLSKSSVVG